MRAIRWFLVNGLFAVVAYYGLYAGVEGALNVLLTFAWIVVVMAFFMLHDDTVKAMAKKGRRVPSFINISYDILMASAFAWYGHEVLATFWVLHLLIQEAAWSKAKELKNESA